MTSGGSAVRRGYQPALDGLRAFAVLGVIGLHTETRWLPGGGIGVFIFFTLSGYLITHLLLLERERTHAVRLRAFYARRALRLFPALAALIVATTVYALTHPGAAADTTLSAIPAVILYVGNWLAALGDPNALGAFGHTWSLAVEEQFYLVWPLILLLAMRRGPRRLMQAALVLAVLSALIRVPLWSAYGQHRMGGTDAIADQLLWGCALAAGLHAATPAAIDRVRQWLTWIGPLAMAYLAAVALLAHTATGPTRPFWLAELPAVGIASAAVIGWLVLRPGNPLARLLATRPLVALGKISYGVYLWHILVIVVVLPKLDLGRQPLRLLAVVVISTAVAAVSWLVIERPALRLKERRFAAAT